MATKKIGEVVELKNLSHTFGEAEVNFGIMTTENQPLLFAPSEFERAVKRGQRNLRDFECYHFENPVAKIVALENEIRAVQRQKEQVLNEKIDAIRSLTERIQSERMLKWLYIATTLIALGSHFAR